ncbi:hypothetical protein L3X38_004112 [Prunus dulcis]|uniref:Sieve element occlusion N-terminal domain-containing protein n=1 Tax=Prunus dulcis TaxID=3755 RepID=A0AAD4ZNF2_PRUDU|nr:hypothetical protein L3X38_004112 [Prunus dulcis]
MVVELNNLIMETYHVIGYIVKLEDLLQHYNPNDVPTLTTAMKKIPMAVFWTINTIVACTAEINRLTSDKEESENLPKLSLKINEIHQKLKEDYDRCMTEKVELRRRMENQRNTFFIGGKNQKMTSDLCSKITKAKLAIEIELKMHIGLASVTKELETEKTFWAGMENLFFSLHYKKT